MTEPQTLRNQERRTPCVEEITGKKEGSKGREHEKRASEKYGTLRHSLQAERMFSKVIHALHHLKP